MLRQISLVGALTFLAGCQQPLTAPTPEPPAVTVTSPVQKNVELYREFTGRTRAVERAEIRARVQGELEAILFKDSDDVTKGDPLFTIEPDPYQAALKHAKADLESKKATFKLAQANHARGQKLIIKKAISQQELDVMNAEVSEANAAISGAEAVIAEAQLQLDYTGVTSPIDGRIDRNLVDLGNLVGAGDATLLATVVRLDPILAYFDIDEQTYLGILETNGGAKREKEDQRPPIFLARQNDKDYPFQGKIDFIDNEIDPNTGTILARGTFANPDLKLTPGMFVRLRIPRKILPNAISVREEAIGTDMQGKYVLVVDAKNMVVQRRVEIGALRDGLRVIESGLTADDKYIVKGMQRARPGLPVRPEMVQEITTPTGE